MLTISDAAAQAKNRLADDGVFLIACELIIPGLTENIYVVQNNEDIVWRGHTWQWFPFVLGEIKSSSKTEVPRVEVRIDNTTRAMEAYINAYDIWCKQNGYAPIECYIYVVYSKNLADPTPEVTHYYHLVQPKASPEWVTFTLGAANPFNMLMPKRRIINFCQWKFKDATCQYSGPATTCNKSFSRCRELNNVHRYGGFLSIGKVIG